jgi:NAD(P)-dependent dehydrogenase (short-subunit alcohol dehydrogenase family)
MAEILTRARHTVFASMRDVASKHRDQANALRKQGIAVVELDVSNDASVDAAVKEVLARANRVDVSVLEGLGLSALTILAKQAA